MNYVLWFFFSSRRRHTRCALVTGVQTCALPISGVESPVKVDSPQFYVHWQLRAGSRTTLPAEYSERAVYVARGDVEVAGQRIEVGSMAVLAPGKAATIVALGDAVLMALGGEPVGPRSIDWNFVLSSKEPIERARRAWARGRVRSPAQEKHK